MNQARVGPTGRGAMASVLRRNIEVLAEVRRRTEHQKTRQEKVADAITTFTGSLRFVYLHAAFVGGWIAVNLGAIPGMEPFDPFPFVMLAMIASVEAIFLSTFVLISNNRMAAVSGRRDELDVQISLLAEHEITRLIEMVEALMKHNGVQVPTPSEIDELKRDVKPERVVAEIQKMEGGG
jgi:uncharacterized membrane protein